MSLQDYLLPLFYKLAWLIQKMRGKTIPLTFYCADPLDYYMFQPIRNHIGQEVEYIAKNKKTRNFFDKHTIAYRRYPAFPDVVIMARHAAFKFPVHAIKKIGFDHGLYQFKRWTSSKYYNLFDIYFVSSPRQVELAKERGITTTRAIGYPKLDKLFNGDIDKETLDKFRLELNLDPNKKTVIFTSTWDVGGLSALNRWVDRVGELTSKYNILLTVHTWSDPKSIEKLRRINGAVYLDAFDIAPYLPLCDVFVGDYNSLIGEFCALNKPIITFRVPLSERAVPEVHQLIGTISIQIDTFDEIEKALERCIKNPDEKSDERQRANKIFYLKLDGQAGRRAAEYIRAISGGEK